MRYWGKIKTEDRILRDQVQEDTDFAAALDALCNSFDIGKPIVCSKHLQEMKSFRRTQFYPDDFVESVIFDVFEIEIIDTKKNKQL
jgi:hypothetical protein